MMKYQIPEKINAKVLIMYIRTHWFLPKTRNLDEFQSMLDKYAEQNCPKCNPLGKEGGIDGDKKDR